MSDQEAPAGPPKTWFYWIAYSFSGGGGAIELAFTAPITRGVELVEAGKQIARACGEPQCIVKTFTLLRVEDTPVVPR